MRVEPLRKRGDRRWYRTRGIIELRINISLEGLGFGKGRICNLESLIQRVVLLSIMSVDEMWQV